MWRFRIQEA
ncbi:unnamed protein product [Linum tenue]|uniref:Uncharacterized protein n=1 Tax=Linum tenue TaxID=586396 RepID=A0AAV0JMQ3_9ROSI|nr:unnamed protein product [Linum tenue]